MSGRSSARQHAAVAAPSSRAADSGARQHGASARAPSSRNSGGMAGELAGPSALSAAGNLAMQRALAPSALSRLIPSGGPPPIQRKCAGDCQCKRCQKKGTGQAAPAGPAPQISAAISSSSGAPMAPHLVSEFSPRFGFDLGDVRIHTDAHAAEAAAGMTAHAFTRGSDIYFARDQWQPGTHTGRTLLAHELTHVVQQGRAGGPGVEAHKDEGENTGDSAAEREADATAERVTSDVSVHVSATPEGVARDDDRPLSERVEDFKASVLATAKQRLRDNRANLAQWAMVVEHVLTVDDVRALGMAQEGGRGLELLEQIQEEANPVRRELKAGQIVGRYQACMGCHMEQMAVAAEHEGHDPFDPNWQTPNARRFGREDYGFDAPPLFNRPFLLGANFGNQIPAIDHAALLAWAQSDTASTGASSSSVSASASSTSAVVAPSGTAVPTMPTIIPGRYRPPTGSFEAHIDSNFPDPRLVPAAVARMRPVLQSLGPEGYQVIPGSIIERLLDTTPQQLRTEILGHISQRRADYLSLMGMIDSGDVEWFKFQPIVRDLLSVATPDVQAAIRAELERREFWKTVESIIVGVLSVLALILAIFPPTTALGIAALASLEIGLGMYAMQEGREGIRTGTAYGLAMGADDVFSREQQESGSGMILAGYFSFATGFFSVLSGGFRAFTAARAFAPARSGGTALARSGAAALEGAPPGTTVSRGPYTAVLQRDGSIHITNVNHPDLLVIIRGDQATAYQMLGGGGMRVMGSGTIPMPAVVPEVLALPATASGELALVCRAPRAQPLLTAPPAPFGLLGAGPSSRVPSSWSSSPEFNALAAWELPPVGSPTSGARWVRTPDGAWAPEFPATTGEGSALTTYGSGPQSSFLLEVPGQSTTALVRPRTGNTYQGPRDYPMTTADMTDPLTGTVGARSHLVPHADTPAGPLVSTGEFGNYTGHMSHVYNERIRRTLEQRFRAAGQDWVAYNTMGDTPRLTTGGSAIPDAEVIMQLGPNGPVRAWRFPNDPTLYQSLPANFDDALAPFLLPTPNVPLTPTP